MPVNTQFVALPNPLPSSATKVIVTTFEFALHPVGPTLMFSAPLYPLSAGSAPIRFWRDFLADKNDTVFFDATGTDAVGAITDPAS